MLTIRSTQLERFRQQADQRFEDELLEYLSEWAPILSETLGKPQMGRVIRLGISRAERYGFTNHGPTRFYVELMFALGSYFDEDPQLPWAKDILTDPAIPTQMSRAEALYRAMNEYLDRVLGRENEYLIEALRRVSEGYLEQYYDLSNDFEQKAIAAMRLVYPEKSEYVGDTTLREQLVNCIALADKYLLPTGQAKMLMFGLIFGLGHGAIKDPVYPWIASTLTDSLVTDSEKRTVRLYKKTRLYLDHLLQHLG